MADEEVMGSASPAPFDHKRKLDDLDSEPYEQQPNAAESNGNSEAVADGDGDSAAARDDVSPEDPDSKRPRLDDKPDGFEAAENGHQEEERAVEPKEDVAEQLVVDKNTETEGGQEKADEPKDAENKESLTVETHYAENKESLTDEIHEGASKPHPEENHEESAKGEPQEPTGVHAPDSPRGGDAIGLEQQSTSADQLTSCKMEVPNNKVGVLIGKSGDTIRMLQHNSGARIQITRDADADPHSATRPVELIGSVESINKAEKLIKDVIAEADAGGSPSLVARGFGTVQSSAAGEQIQIQVPNEKVSLIIGRGGETIKSLQTRSGARIQLIPQHLPEGDQSKERTVRVTGDRKQIEIASEMIKEVMNQPIRSSAPSSGYMQQSFRPMGPGPQWGHRGHSSQPSGYDYPQRGLYPAQNPHYPSQAFGNYPPQQPPPRNIFGWEQRPPTNLQGPPVQAGYDYYGGQGGHTAASYAQPPMLSHAPGPGMGPPPSQAHYNYGPQQGPDYGQQLTPYPQTAPQGYGHGYGEGKYDNQGSTQHPYGGQGTQPSTYPQGTTHAGYGQQDQYGKPPAYNLPQQGAYAQPYGQPRPSQPREVPYQGLTTQAYPNAPAQQQPYPYASSGPMQQHYPQYATAPATNDGYGNSTPASGGYPQQSSHPVSGYAQTGGQPQAPGYAAAPTAGYGQYPPAQPGYVEQAAPSNAGFGYLGTSDPTYAVGPGAAYGAPPAGQPLYSQPAPTQSGSNQSVPQSGGGYGNVPVAYGKSVSPQPQMQPQPQLQPQPQPQSQADYAQYDGSQMYSGYR